MKNINSLVYECESKTNSKLYEFLATNYNISNLANKISATKKAPANILNLKKILSNKDIATA